MLDGQWVDRNDRGLPAVPKFDLTAKMAPGTVGDFWLEHDRRLPIVVNAAMWRRRVLFSYGGWPAISTGEDASLTLAISEQHPFMHIAERLSVYRMHPESTMHKP